MTIAQARKLYQDARAAWLAQGGPFADAAFPVVKITGGSFAGLSGRLAWAGVGPRQPGRAPHMGNAVYARPSEIEPDTKQGGRS